MKELFTGINYLFKEIHTKKKGTCNVEKQYNFLDNIQKNNHKLLSINIEKKDTNSLQVVNYNYSVNYIIGINFTKSNTHAYVTDSEGRLKFYCSAGVLQQSGENKKSRFYVLKNIYRILVTRLTFLKDEPVALHLKNVGFSTTSIVKKLKRIAFIMVIKDFSVMPFNGCRLQKVPRKRVKKSMAKKKPVRINANLDMDRSLIKVVKKQQPDYWNVYKNFGKFINLKLNENSSAEFVFLKSNKQAAVKKGLTLIKHRKNFSVSEINPVLPDLIILGCWWRDFFIQCLETHANSLTMFVLSVLSITLFKNFLAVAPSPTKAASKGSGKPENQPGVKPRQKVRVREAVRMWPKGEIIKPPTLTGVGIFSAPTKQKPPKITENPLKGPIEIDEIDIDDVLSQVIGCKAIVLVLMVDNNLPCLLYPNIKFALSENIQFLLANPFVQKATVHPSIMHMGYSLQGSFVGSGRFEYIVVEVSLTQGYKDANVIAVKELLCDCRDLLALNHIRSYIYSSFID